MKYLAALLLSSPWALIALWCKLTGTRYSDLHDTDNWLDKWVDARPARTEGWSAVAGDVMAPPLAPTLSEPRPMPEPIKQQIVMGSEGITNVSDRTP